MTRNSFGRRTARLYVEHLEDRSVPSTFTVDTTLDDLTAANGKQSLREAITRANINPGPDTIILPAGVFKITVTGVEVNPNFAGDFDITDALTIQGAGAGVSIVDGQQVDRVFDVLGTAPSSIKVVFAGLTIRNGNATGDGGGIRVGNADLVVRDSAVTGNRASQIGGGISTNLPIPDSGNVKIVRSTVARNVAGGLGGGLFAVGSSSVVTVTDGTVRRNVAGGNGGGLFATTATLTDSIVNGNHAAKGGGIEAGTATLIGTIVSGNSTGSNGGGIEAGTMTLTNSTVSDNRAAGFGGGINAETATLTDSIVNGNSSIGRGGGLFADTATLTNSIVSGNTAGGDGGGLFAFTATLTTTTVSGNTATSGGGINAATATLTASTVSDNRAVTDGGGIAAGEATLTKSTVSGNSTGGDGGGISAGTTTLTNSTVSDNSSGGNGGGILAGATTVTRSTVSGNSAATDGGGIFLLGEGILTNCTLSGNSAGSRGGGIIGSTATLLNCTIVENSAHTGGGIFFDPGTAFSLRNTIVALNLTDFTGSAPDVSGDLISAGHNLIGNSSGSTAFTNGLNSDIVGDSINPIDPNLGPLQNNGGKTQTHKLRVGSPAIDAGDNSLLPPTDQRGAGFARLKDGNFDGVAIVDIGAFER